MYEYMNDKLIVTKLQFDRDTETFSIINPLLHTKIHLIKFRLSNKNILVSCRYVYSIPLIITVTLP